jgi:hypothetical protein
VLIAFAAFVCLAPVVAQATVRKQYEVNTDKGKVVRVSTAADRETVAVTIERQGGPANTYVTYPQAATTVVSTGKRVLFNHHFDAKTLAGNDFNFQIGRESGPERARHKSVVAIRQQLKDDMRVLSAVRGFDPDADVILAELAYVVLTYDNSMLDAAPPSGYSVYELARTSAGRLMRSAKVVRASLRATIFCDLNECKDTCDGHYSACMADQSFTDKTPCHNNRSSCNNNCYRSCSIAPEKPPEA